MNYLNIICEDVYYYIVAFLNKDDAKNVSKLRKINYEQLILIRFPRLYNYLLKYEVKLVSLKNFFYRVLECREMSKDKYIGIRNVEILRSIIHSEITCLWVPYPFII